MLLAPASEKAIYVVGMLELCEGRSFLYLGPLFCSWPITWGWCLSLDIGNARDAEHIIQSGLWTWWKDTGTYIHSSPRGTTVKSGQQTSRALWHQ